MAVSLFTKFSRLYREIMKIAMLFLGHKVAVLSIELWGLGSAAVQRQLGGQAMKTTYGF